MSNQSNIFGRAYEYICIETLNNEINKFRNSIIEESSTYEIAKDCWNIIDEEAKSIFKNSALSATYSIFDLEPIITEQGKDNLVLKMQKDQKGESGDVRDIIIIRNTEKWEIGLSIKHNHFAVKHSRLGTKLDFGERWYGIKCSEQYWNEIKPIFEYINLNKEQNKKWSELEDKENDVYVPLLNAFINELKKSYQEHQELPKKLVEYLLGEFDFYKVISVDNKIHNASTYVENSLKFDIQIVGMPASIISIESKWNEE